jgi:TonB family protein
MSNSNRTCILCAFLFLGEVCHGVASDWSFAPQPEFPSGALSKGSEGVVKLRLVLSKDGAVVGATVLKSSGDTVLDGAARAEVLKWKMKRDAIKPSDLTKGRIEEVEFRQEAMRSATYPLDVRAGFSGEKEWKQWVHAPFPYYPLRSRRLRHMGTTLLSAAIGKDGQVTAVQIIKSSGYSDLDEEASKAVRHWRAHKEYAGQHLEVPVRFSLG